MKELFCQKLVIEAVTEADVGGQGLQFNNRFIIGVTDLLIALPGVQPMILEAKLHSFSERTLENGHQIADIGCTKLQKDYLRDWGRAGVLTGVVSFILPIGGNVGDLMMAVVPYVRMVKQNWSIHTDVHTPLGGKDERLPNIRQQLKDFANG